MEKGCRDTWMKPRHQIVRNIAYFILKPYSRWKYGITSEVFKEQGDRQYLILFNHQTPFDQFFVGMSFDGPIYYLATEDIFSNGWISSLLRWLAAPIPIKKQTTDLRAVKNCVRVAKEGGTIALSPEGNRTYSGKTEYIKPAIVSLARVLKLPVVLYRIEGGYGVEPRWSNVVRKGKMRSYVAQVIEPEEYKNMSDEEFLLRIQEGLDVNEAVADGIFQHKKRAEYLERAIYVCPYCGLSVFESHNEIVECKKCGRKIIYQPTKELTGVDFEFPFSFVSEWYDYQKMFVNALDINAYLTVPLYQDQADVSEVIVYERKKTLRKQANILLYGDRIVIDEEENAVEFYFDDVSAVSVLGRNKLNIYHDKKVYQLKGNKRFNALKYVNIYYHYKNTKEKQDGSFLGL